MSIQIRAFLLLAFAAIVWGLSFKPTQWILETSGVYEYLFYRFFISAIVFFLITKKDILLHYKKTYFCGIITGICMGIAFVTQTLALPHTQSSSVAFLTGLSVIIVPFLNFIINKEKISIKAVLLSFIACIGMFFFSDANLNNFGIGEYFSIICAFFFGLLIILNTRYLKDNDLNTFVFFQFLGCVILCFLASIFLDKLSVSPIKNLDVFLYIVAAALVLTIFCFFAQNYAQKYLSAEKVAILLLLEPISAGILGYFYGEIFTTLQIIGAGLILIALAFS
ncbi:DMT family transporter [Campylobacter sp. MG1]|uniref:DMT family transporter n=1 Tax=Campylobacter sp. MG1 TaxID=2976332 RepID=UPI00226C8124|nr:DMT family transporter [Campylobacter sp. MG1]